MKLVKNENEKKQEKVTDEEARAVSYTHLTLPTMMSV